MSYPADSTTGSTGLNDLSTGFDYLVVAVVLLVTGSVLIGAVAVALRAFVSDSQEPKDGRSNK